MRLPEPGADLREQFRQTLLADSGPSRGVRDPLDRAGQPVLDLTAAAEPHHHGAVRGGEHVAHPVAGPRVRPPRPPQDVIVIGEQGPQRRLTQLWSPTRSDPRGDQDYVFARLEISRGRLDTAEPFAAASVRRWEGVSELRRTHSAIVLATVHVQAGEPNGLAMAHRAIIDVTKLSSVQARTRLHPLTAALENRPNRDTKELARMARQVAATQA
ncbi:MAG: hypothetical protein LC799_29805 [Actinobacteria bacterium]|nr:hypothetical protein [Actinomycetota bacterium]